MSNSIFNGELSCWVETSRQVSLIDYLSWELIAPYVDFTDAQSSIVLAARHRAQAHESRIDPGRGTVHMAGDRPDRPGPRRLPIVRWPPLTRAFL